MSTTPIAAPPRVPRTPMHFSERSRLLGSENAFRIGPHIAAIEAQGRHVVRCNLGEPDFPVPRHITDEVKRRIDAGDTHYCDPQGILPLRRAIATHIGRTRNLPVTPEQVVVFPGAKPPIGFAQTVYADPGDEVVYPSPGFPIYESFTRFLGLRPRPLHLREELDFRCGARDLEPLLTDRTRLVILNFPSNPTGGVATRAQLEEIADLLRRRDPADLRVYSDEVYEDILFDGHEHVSIASLPGMAERTIVVGGVSKSFAWTGGRVGWAVLPTVEEAQVFRNMNINYFSCVPAYNQHGARVGLEAPETVAAMRTMVDAFQERRDRMVRGLQAIDGVTCRTPGGAFYLFPNVSGLCRRLGAIEAWERFPESVRDRTSPATLFQMFLLWRHGVATLDRRSFGRIGSDGQHYLRLSIATAMSELEEALVRLRAAAGDTAGFAAFVAEGAHLW